MIIFGPPGCGKTTEIGRRIEHSVMSGKRDPEKILVTSFTRTAAVELAERLAVDSEGRQRPPGKRIPDRNIGTLHSMAFRGIDQPLAFEPKFIRDWNDRHPGWALESASRGAVEESPAEWSGSSDGTKLLGEIEILRNRLIPTERWPKQSLVNFHEAWTAWKREAEVVDFTDMLEIALADVPYAPGRPELIFADEQQDSTPLEMALLQKWGAQADRIVYAGDDDQCLYRFRGASPDTLVDMDVPDEDRIILGQSYRVPARVLTVADAWIQQVTHRQPKTYLPRDSEGSVRTSPYSFKEADDLIREVEAEYDAGRTVMLMASCSYQLDDVKKELRRRGLPFQNKYRRSRGDWNPMAPSTKRTVSSVDRLVSYLVMDERIFGDRSRIWTGRDLKLWIQLVRATGVLRRGAKGAVESLPDRELTQEEVAQLFASDEHFAQAVEPSLDWLVANLTAEGAKKLEYPISVFRQRGVEALTAEPRIEIGTTHSFKGAEADTVFVCPDLSMAAAKEWDDGGEGRDSVVRQFYVAMTRARENLVICAPSGRLYAPIAEGVKP